MTRPLICLIAICLCLAASSGCKSIRHRHASTKSSATSAVAAKQAEPQQDLAIGQASYEQFADNPGTDPYGRTPYHFGGSSGASGQGASKKC